MSADKLQAVHEALADLFNKPNSNVVSTETSNASFDREALSEALSKHHPHAVNAEYSFARFDHAALTGIFNEIPPTSATERSSDFNQAFAEILSENPPLSSNAQSAQPDFDQRALSETLGKPSSVSSNPSPPQPSFDHQALAEMLAGSRADPIDPQISRSGYNAEPASAPLLDRFESPAASSAIAPPASAESAPSRRATSLLARLHHMFSAKEETLLPEEETKSLDPLPAGHAHTPETIAEEILTPVDAALPINALPVEFSPLSFEQESLCLTDHSVLRRPVVDAVAVTASTDVASALLRRATSWPDNSPTLISSYTASSSPNIEAKPSIPAVADRLIDVDPKVGSVAVNATAGAEEALLQTAHSHTMTAAEGSVLAAIPANAEVAPSQPPAPLLPERPSLISKEAESSSFETPTGPSPPTSSIETENTSPATNAAALAFQISVENAQLERLRVLTARLTPKLSADPKPTLATSKKEPSSPPPSIQLESLGPLASTVSVGRTANSASETVPPLQTEPLLSEILSPASSNSEWHPVNFGNEASPTLAAGEPNHLGLAIEPVAAPPQPDTRAAQTKPPPVADTSALFSTNAITSSQSYEQKSEPSLPSGRADGAASLMNSLEVASRDAKANPPEHESSLLAALDVLNTRPSPRRLEEPPRSVMPEMPALASIDLESSATIFEQERAPPASDQPAHELGSSQPASSTSSESAAARAQQAKSLLDELDLATAIQLRWTMRDIRSKRTKFSPVGADDLTALLNLGLVELRDDLPRLTALGVLALD